VKTGVEILDKRRETSIIVFTPETQRFTEHNVVDTVHNNRE
jgi:hypothetical protein